MSSYHVVSYGSKLDEIESKGTFQGFADSSRWSRGQAWGLYGYTVCYRETKDTKYLDAAQKIASLIMKKLTTPEDKIPFWDYNAPNMPNEPRDASAAAITASALFELSTYTNDSTYFKYGEDILKNLSAAPYLAQKGGDNLGFILKHSTGSLPHKSEIDAPLNYADYYFLEAMKRYLELQKIDYPISNNK